jgi:hypothetical protein
LFDIYNSSCVGFVGLESELADRVLKVMERADKNGSGVITFAGMIHNYDD